LSFGCTFSWTTTGGRFPVSGLVIGISAPVLKWLIEFGGMECWSVWQAEKNNLALGKLAKRLPGSAFSIALAKAAVAGDKVPAPRSKLLLPVSQAG
jgi:hypothetical protein